MEQCHLFSPKKLWKRRNSVLNKTNSKQKIKYRTQHQQRPSRSYTNTVVMGTSLVRGLGNELSKNKVDVTVYTYPGATVKRLRERVTHVFKKDSVSQIVLQCAGNDLDSLPTHEIVSEYDKLIKDIRKQCPKSHIIISKLPPRQYDIKTLKRIDMINTYLENRGKRGDGVTCVNVVPSQKMHFKKDLIHFNNAGV